jgi:hypothetical protein
VIGWGENGDGLYDVGCGMWDVYYCIRGDMLHISAFWIHINERKQFSTMVV